MGMKLRFLRIQSILVAAVVHILMTVPAAAQTGQYDAYLNYAEMTEALRAMSSSHPDISHIQSICRTAEGRDIWLVQIGNSNGRDPDTRPAILIVANIEANHVIGSMTALYLIDYLLSGYGTTDDVTDLLNTRTLYIIPRLNPDGAERFWTMPQIEFPYKPNSEDEDRDGFEDEDPGDDLNGDGFVTMMRVRDPDGEWMVDPDEPRLMKRADRTRGERGVYKVYMEGRDDDDDGEYNEDGLGGTNLNMNWPHRYRYFADHTGINQVSEMETRALADFAFTHRNLAMALTFSSYDNLLSAPVSRARREAPVNIPADLELPADMTMEGVAEFFREPVAPAAILPQDSPYFSFISEKFGEMTGLSGNGASGEAGSWPQFAYYQLGLPSFTTPVWTLPRTVDPENGRSNGQSSQSSRPDPRSRQNSASDDSRWLNWFDEKGIHGFVDWTPASHPTLGEIEVGGFIPNVRVNPPVDQISDLARKHAEFSVWLAKQTAVVTLVDTRVEARGDGFFLINATVQNDSYLPSALTMGTTNGTAFPVILRLLPTEGMKVIDGDIQQQIRVVNGSGGRSEVSWLVQAAIGSTVTLEVLAERAGGLRSVTLTLGQGSGR